MSQREPFGSRNTPSLKLENLLGIQPLKQNKLIRKANNGSIS